MLFRSAAGGEPFRKRKVYNIREPIRINLPLPEIKAFLTYSLKIRDLFVQENESKFAISCFEPALEVNNAKPQKTLLMS